MLALTGAQLIGTVLAIVSGVLLVVFFAKLDELISRKYQRTFEVILYCLSQLISYHVDRQEEISRGRLTSMAGVIGHLYLLLLLNIKHIRYISDT